MRLLHFSQAFETSRPEDAMGEDAPSKTARMQPGLTLYYFNFPGLGESTRLALTYVGLAFEDVRLKYWEFEELKASGTLAFGQIPALKVEVPQGSTEMLVQSAAILRYIGRLVGKDRIYPDDLLKAARVDAIIDQVANDMVVGMTASQYQERHGFDKALGGKWGEGTKLVSIALQEEIIPRHFGHFSRLLESSQTGWLAGTEGPSIADFIATPLLEWVRDTAEDGTKLFAPFPKLTELINRFYDIPEIKAYYEKKSPA